MSHGDSIITDRRCNDYIHNNIVTSASRDTHDPYIDSNTNRNGGKGCRDNEDDANSINKEASSEKSDASKDEQKNVAGAPPDGGWGWVVVLSSFFISVIVDGICYSQGIYFDSFQAEFKTDKATTSWIGSVISGTYSLVGTSF